MLQNWFRFISLKMEGTSLALELLHVMWAAIKKIHEEKEDMAKVHAFFANQLKLSKVFDPLLKPVNGETVALAAAVSE